LNIWIDILTPKQILFFTPLIHELRARGHEVLSTSRRYREVDLLLSKMNLDIIVVGKHGGGLLQEKLKASSERALGLSDEVEKLSLDYAVSFSSPECARVAFGLGVKHICISDSPHSEKVCRLTIPLSEILLAPWVIPFSAWHSYGIGEDSLVKYRALDPVVWLRRRSAEVGRKEEYGLDSSKKTIMLRLEESQAAYMLSSDKSYSKILLDTLLAHFEDCELFVLGRYASEISAIQKAYGSRLRIAEDVVDGAGIISVSDVFVGMGGTMTTEAALLGIPTVSAFQGGRMYVDDFLINEGLLVKPGNVEQVINTVGDLLQNQDKRRYLQTRAKTVLDRMEDPVKVVIDTLEKDAEVAGLL
jgi:predicted glycosyltransferase